MRIFSHLSLKKGDLVWIFLSLLVLLPTLYYPYVLERESPDFTLDRDRVMKAAPCQRADCLHPGDKLLTLGTLDYATYSASRTAALFSGAGNAASVEAKVLRNGRPVSVRVAVPAAVKKGMVIPATGLVPLVFWLTGTVAIIFLRPRDERWFVLVGFTYVTAIWFAAGLPSWMNVRLSTLVFHTFIWWFMPLSVHLHLILPTSLLKARARRILLSVLYSLALVLTILDLLQLLGRGWVVLVTFAGILASLVLLLLRLFRKDDPAVQVASRIMFFGLVFGLGPFVFFFILFPSQLLGMIPGLPKLSPWADRIAVLSLPMLPMAYIYAIYKHHLGALEFRANRLLGVYSFSALSITTYVLVLFLVSGYWAQVNEHFLAAVFTVSLAFAAGTPLLREPFQKLVDRHIFGIRHSPEEVVNMVSGRIATAFSREVLAQLLTGEVLPTLLVRQSALYLFERGDQEALYEQNLPAAEPPITEATLQTMLARAGHYLPPSDAQPPCAWVRLVIPLTVQGEAVGAWLIGRRDPDDFFPVSDIRLLSTIANQIAPMVGNIRLYERAQQEIAHRRSAEDRIRRSEERFRNLFEATLEGIAIVRNGVILEVNQALLAIFGYEARDLIGKELADLLPEASPAFTGEARETIGWKLDGSVVDVEIAAKQYVFQGEDVTVVAIRDIARRKRDEAENRALQRQLQVSQKMEAIGRLSAGVAHDFNNCLLVIFGYSDLLLERYNEDHFLQRNLGGLKDAAQKAASLTKQLLAFARRQPMETKVMDLNAVIKGVEKMLQRLLGEDVALATDLHSNLGRVKIDPSQLEQVVINLAVNARQAMPTGGKLTVRTAPVTVAPPGTGADAAAAAHTDVPPGSYVLLEVTDTGIGMDAETQARAFEPFFSTKGEGTGLGLATAYGIVRQSGGQIFVDSAPEKGARFSIYLPVTSDRESVATFTPVKAMDTGTEAILLVEDEDGVRAVLQRILSSRGYRVLPATGADEAMEVARRHRGRVDLLLTDITMPRMKGPELAAKLLSEQPRMRVIYMSGYSEGNFDDGDKAPLCLQKPFSAQTLARTVRTVLDTPLPLARRA